MGTIRSKHHQVLRINQLWWLNGIWYIRRKGEILLIHVIPTSMKKSLRVGTHEFDWARITLKFTQIFWDRNFRYPKKGWLTKCDRPPKANAEPIDQSSCHRGIFTIGRFCWANGKIPKIRFPNHLLSQRGHWSKFSVAIFFSLAASSLKSPQSNANRNVTLYRLIGYYSLSTNTSPFVIGHVPMIWRKFLVWYGQ